MENQIIATRYANKQKLYNLLKQIFPQGGYTVEVSIQPHMKFAILTKSGEGGKLCSDRASEARAGIRFAVSLSLLFFAFAKRFFLSLGGDKRSKKGLTWPRNTAQQLWWLLEGYWVGRHVGSINSSVLGGPWKERNILNPPQPPETLYWFCGHVISAGCSRITDLCCCTYHSNFLHRCITQRTLCPQKLQL